jgi:HPt (histidine-containing phosphotransfer) domain-containing protein
MSLNLETLASSGFDMNRVAELVELFGTREDVFNLIGEMYADAPEIISEIETFIKAENNLAAMQKAHYLKGVASGVGAKEIAESAICLEHKLREKGDPAAELNRLRTAWGTLAKILA